MEKYKNIEFKNPNCLIGYENNAKKHSGQQIDLVAKSIIEFGFINPVIIDDSGTIIAGHCRVESAKKIGLEKIPTLKVSHLTEAQKKAYIIADNRLSEIGSFWDNDVLNIELSDISESGIQIELTGFTEDFLSDDTGEIDFGNDKDEKNNSGKENNQSICPKCGCVF